MKESEVEPTYKKLEEANYLLDEIKACNNLIDLIAQGKCTVSMPVNIHAKNSVSIDGDLLIFFLQPLRSQKERLQKQLEAL